MEEDVVKKSIMNVIQELDKLSAFLHLDREEMQEGKESEEKPEMGDMLAGMEEMPEMEEGEGVEQEEPEMEEKKPALKIDILKVKKGKKGAFA